MAFRDTRPYSSFQWATSLLASQPPALPCPVPVWPECIFVGFLLWPMAWGSGPSVVCSGPTPAPDHLPLSPQPAFSMLSFAS